MKVINMIIEIITAPFALIIRSADTRKISLSGFAKPLMILFISLLVVAVFVLFYYGDIIFAK